MSKLTHQPYERTISEMTYGAHYPIVRGKEIWIDKNQAKLINIIARTGGGPCAVQKTKTPR
jgi:hypothetical protein